MKPMNDMIELSDHFRRNAEFEARDAVIDLVGLTRKFANEVTWVDFTLPCDNEINVQTIKFQKDLLAKMVVAAKEAGLNGIVLPLHEESPLAEFVQDHVIARQDLGLPIVFRTSDYKRDLAVFGDIDPAIKTALDEGVRGVCAIDSDLKYKWDSDMRLSLA